MREPVDGICREADKVKNGGRQIAAFAGIGFQPVMPQRFGENVADPVAAIEA